MPGWTKKQSEKRATKRKSEREKAKAEGIGSAAQHKERTRRTRAELREPEPPPAPKRTTNGIAPVTLPNVAGRWYVFIDGHLMVGD